MFLLNILIKRLYFTLLIGALSLGSAMACDPLNSQFGDSREISVSMKQAFGYGSMVGHKQLPLAKKEVVLTFDDGPWRGTTHKILDVLDKYCAHATFFPIGKHVKRFPDILREVHKRGHTIGSHSWSHNYHLMGGNIRVAYKDIMHGARMIAQTAHIPLPTFFRYPGFKERKSVDRLIRKHNFVVFSTDVDSVDWRMKSSKALLRRVFSHLKKKGKGILIFHDNKKLTARSLDMLLSGLKRRGYKIVHVRPQNMMYMAKAANERRHALAEAKTLSEAEKYKVANSIMPVVSLGVTPSLLLYGKVISRYVLQNVYARNIALTLHLILLVSWLSFKFILYFPVGIYHLPRRRWYWSSIDKP